MSSHRRRLSAVLHADLTGFVRLMEGAEDRTVSHLRSAQDEIWRPSIQAAGGLVVDDVGDSILAEFSSPRAAVAAAIDIQERMAQFNDMLEEEQRLLFRIGLHLGEIIVDEEKQAIFGDGVNVAARIQAMADPGGIAVSRALRDVTELHIDHAFVDGGEHALKNVSRPVQIYHVRSRAGSSTRTTTSVIPERTLRFRGTDRAGKRYGFDVIVEKLIALRDGLVIGRDVDQCDIVLSHSTISRRHARLAFREGAVRIEDLGSLNRTSVDGESVQPGKRCRLEIGATVKMGEIELRLASE